MGQITQPKQKQMLHTQLEISKGNILAVVLVIVVICVLEPYTMQNMLLWYTFPEFIANFHLQAIQNVSLNFDNKS